VAVDYDYRSKLQVFILHSGTGDSAAAAEC